MTHPADAFPNLTLPLVVGAPRALNAPGAGTDWQLVVVYRGFHCPICKGYLKTLEELAPQFRDIGVDVLAVSGDGREKAHAMQEETGVTLPLAYDMSIAQMLELGLFVSDPRDANETDQPFPEPGLFVINDAGVVQVKMIGNASFARPDLNLVLRGLTVTRERGFPIRGLHGL